MGLSHARSATIANAAGAAALNASNYVDRELRLEDTNKLYKVVAATGNAADGTGLIDTSGTEQLQRLQDALDVLTTANRDAIASPAQGYLAYNSDRSRLETYNGSSWRDVLNGQYLDADFDSGMEVERTDDSDTIVLKTAGADRLTMDSATAALNMPTSITDAVGGSNRLTMNATESFLNNNNGGAIYFTGTSANILGLGRNGSGMAYFLGTKLAAIQCGDGTGAGATDNEVQLITQNFIGSTATVTLRETGSDMQHTNGGTDGCLVRASGATFSVTDFTNTPTVTFRVVGGATPNTQVIIGNFDVQTGQVGIGQAATSNDASSLLEMASTTQGFRPPSMSTAQKNAITTPVAGLMVYDAGVNQISYYNGTAWVNV